MLHLAPTMVAGPMPAGPWTVGPVPPVRHCAGLCGPAYRGCEQQQ